MYPLVSIWGSGTVNQSGTISGSGSGGGTAGRGDALLNHKLTW